MRAKINGTIYDTETAQRITSWLNKDTRTDLETLYRSRHGQYFLRVASIDGYFRHGGKRDEVIIPMTFERARMWCVHKLPDGRYKQLFSKNKKDRRKKTKHKES